MSNLKQSEWIILRLSSRGDSLLLDSFMRCLNQCILKWGLGQEPHILRQKEQAITEHLKTATLLAIWRPKSCKPKKSSGTVNLLSGIVNKRPVLKTQKYIDFWIWRNCPVLRNLLYIWRINIKKGSQNCTENIRKLIFGYCFIHFPIEIQIIPFKKLPHDIYWV